MFTIGELVLNVGDDKGSKIERCLWTAVVEVNGLGESLIENINIKIISTKMDQNGPKMDQNEINLKLPMIIVTIKFRIGKTE